MPGRLAVDFGTSNTVIACWNPERGEAGPVHLAEYGRLLPSPRKKGADHAVSVIPSLIHYAADGRRWLGQQVLEQDLYGSPRTFRWMKRYIAQRSPLKLRLDGVDISAERAGRDFLSTLLGAVAAEGDTDHEEVALTVPVEAFEHYETWLSDLAEAAGMPRIRLIDEPSAAALGYGATIQPGEAFLVFDFGGGTLDVAVVLVEETELKGRRCRVLGKSGSEAGGATIDAWLFEEVLHQCGRHDVDVRPLSRELLVECERAKEALSSQENTTIAAGDMRVEIDQRRFEDLLDEHDLFTQIEQTVRRALNGSRERGYAEEQLRSVLMVGGSSLIPSVQRFVQRMFGRERVLLGRPLDAVARGAAAFVAGIDFFDHIQHDYAVRYVDPHRGDYEFQPIVRRGTPYPTTSPLARLTVKASHDGQTQLGIAIFEIAESRRPTAGPLMELVFDPSGAARLAQVDAEAQDRREQFWVNEHCPTFLAANPPGRRSEARFEVEFGIDGNKRLLISARDLKTDRQVLRNHPVIKLS
jgi:molecular chaperone DnaK (HSP70)